LLSDTIDWEEGRAAKQPVRALELNGEIEAFAAGQDRTARPDRTPVWQMAEILAA